MPPTVEPTATGAVEVKEPKALETLSPTQLKNWKMTGEVPADGDVEKPAGKEATGKEGKEGKEGAAASEQERQEAPPEKRTVNPKKLGFSDLRKRVADLEAENQQLKTRSAEPPKRTEEPAPAKEAKVETREKPKPDDVDAKGKPKYTTYEDFIEDLTDWKTEQAIKKAGAEAEEKTKLTAAQARDAEVTSAFSKQCEAMRETHADFDAVALSEKIVIPKGSAIEQWVLELSKEGSITGVKILYFLGQHPEEIPAVNAMTPVAAARYLTALQAELEDEDGAQNADDDEQEEDEEVPASSKGKQAIAIRDANLRRSTTPRPTREVGGRGSVTVDEVTKSVADDDVGAYIASANRRDLAKRKRG